MYLGVAKNAPNVAVLGECGRYPIYLYTAKKFIKYWARLINMQNHCFPKKCFILLHNIELSSVRLKHTWVHEVKEILYLCNLQEAWDLQQVGNIDMFMKLFTARFVF